MRFHEYFTSWAILGLIGLILGACSSDKPSLDALDKAIGKAETYLKAQTALKPDELAMLVYIDRKFGLPWVSERVTRKKIAELRAGHWAPFLRLLVPGHIASRESMGLVRFPIDRVTVAALYCDEYALPYGYLGQISEGLRGDGYWPTHAVLAAMWAQENGCWNENSWHTLRPLMREALLTTIAKRPGADDIFAESVAILYYAGFADDVKPVWLAKLIAAQNADGSWRATPESPIPNAHTTGLALWALLEARRGGTTEPVPWLSTESRSTRLKDSASTPQSRQSP